MQLMEAVLGLNKCDLWGAKINRGLLRDDQANSTV